MFRVWLAVCSSKENVFFPWKGRGWLFSPSYWVNNVPGPHVYPHIDFAWIGSSPSMCEKNNFSELEKLFFRKASVFFKLLGKQCSRSPRLSTYRFCVDWKQSKHVRKKQFFGAWKIVFSAKPQFSSSYWVNNVPGPHVHPQRFCVDWKQSKHVRKKQFFGAIFRSLKNCFSAKPKFSSSYWGIQCFRSPRLSTYRFCVDWKQSKHVRKKQFFGAWKLVFLQSPDFIP